jgi:hypothetical protein
VKRTPMTIEQHIALGRAVKAFRSAYLDANIWNAFPKNSPEVNALRRVENAILVMKSRFDSAVCRIVPTHLDAHNDAITVYYDPDDERMERLKAAMTAEGK